MNKRYVVRLEAEERRRLEQLVKVGKVAGYKIRHANMLLMADENGPAMSDEQVSEALVSRLVRWSTCASGWSKTDWTHVWPVNHRSVQASSRSSTVRKKRS